jgi:rubrerythrin
MTAFRPFDEKGTPLEEQFMSWKQLLSQPYDKNNADPYTKTRVILMNGIETNAFITKHALARQIADEGIRENLAMVRRSESMQQQAVEWLNPGNQTILETTIGYEQLAVDLTADLAMNEDDDYQRKTLDFALLEDFDHLYRYAAHMQRMEGKDANSLTKGTIDIKEGRPTKVHHRHPHDEMRSHWDKKTASPKTKMNYLTIVSAEQQTENYYKTHGSMFQDDLSRALYTEIADVEEQHVSQYEALGDATMSPLEMNFLMEVNEAYNYFCCAQSESDPNIKKVWQMMMKDEIGHMLNAIEMLQQFENKDPVKVLGGDTIDAPILLRPTKDYVNQVLAEQKDFQPYEREFIPESQIPKGWASFAFRDKVNGDFIPSEIVVQSGEKQKMPVTSRGR